ncbi:MAG TPA: M18 family aminopeptidase, partial [Polyangiaceae bacterium]|nr:M18 family aminopeptidase [Polyangiaceae bacterium]
MPAADGAKLADFLAFLDTSPTPYHAARAVAARLTAAGFAELDEGAAWNVEAGARAFVLRGGTLLAFVVGTEAPWEAGFVALGAHTDSPNLRLKPQPDLTNAGCRQAAIEVYGGVLLSTWLDRDLSLAGRVTLAGGTTELVRVAGAPFRLPNLAIHLNRDVNKEGLVVNPQTHLTPLWALESSGGRSQVLELVVEALGATPSAGAGLADIVGFDLCLFDAQPASLGGVNGELVSSGRL